MTKIFLGVTKTDGIFTAPGEWVFITKHEWQCDWYWAFGWVGNLKCHFHFDSLMKVDVPYEASEIFSDPLLSDNEWWVLRDLYKQASALKAAAEVYQYGGHQSSKKGVTDVIKNKEKADVLNADLKIVLDVAWDMLEKAHAAKLAVEKEV